MHWSPWHCNRCHSIPWRRALIAKRHREPLTTMPAASSITEVMNMPQCATCGAELEPPVRVPHTVHVKTSTASGVRTTAATTSSEPPWPPASSPRSNPGAAPRRLIGERLRPNMAGPTTDDPTCATRRTNLEMAPTRPTHRCEGTNAEGNASVAVSHPVGHDC